MDFKELLNLGLVEKESKVYLSALELGKAPVQRIAEKAEVKRATTYVIIEALMKKGLMSSITEGKKTYYYAENPEKLSILFKSQETELQRKQEYLEKIMPDLKALNNPDDDHPTVKYYKGKNGVISMVEEFFKTIHHHKKDEEARTIFSADLTESAMREDEWQDIRNKKLSKSISSKAIYSCKKGELKNVSGRKQIKIDSEQYPIEAEIAIFGNKIRMATLKNKMLGIMIEDEEVATTLKTLFDLAWLGIKSIKK